MRSVIIHEIAFIESALDDPENFTMDGYAKKLREIVSELVSELHRLLERSEEGRIYKSGIRTAIVGKPNAGKSSLLNLLSGSERAIVTEIAGTTRDTIDETVRIGDVLLHLTDTAGIRETDDAVEKIGIRKTKEAVELAELILFLLDSSEPFSQEDREIADYLKEQEAEGKKLIILMNKTDLLKATDPLKKEKFLCEADCSEKTVIPTLRPLREIEDCFGEKTPVLFCSMKTGEGTEELKNQIASMFHLGRLSGSNDIYITNVRHKEALSDTLASLQLVLQSIEDDMGEDFYSIDLMSAYKSLGLIIGEQIEDDLVEEIFSSFCLGK